MINKNTATFLVQISFLIFLLIILPANAEEQRDLREGITGKLTEETRWGFLPRFKMNPDTGTGTGVKLKGANVFGIPLYFDIANIFTTTRYQIYETTATVPRIGSGKDYWYFNIFAEFRQIPDMRFFGIGNTTENCMDDQTDNKTGNESTLEFKNIETRVTIGKSIDQEYFIAIEPSWRRVSTGDGENENLPQAVDVYSGLTGIKTENAPAILISLIRSTRNDQWRPSKGSRIELAIKNTGHFSESDYDYSKLTADLRRYFNLFGEYNILAVHARFENLYGSFDNIPWWDMPSAGGRDSLRGYWEGRFRGKRSLLANAEYRFHLFNVSLKLLGLRLQYVFDGNIFYDTGRVFTPGDDMDDKPAAGWKKSGGFGVRLTTPPNLMGRLDIGFSEEMKFALYFNFGTVF